MPKKRHGKQYRKTKAKRIGIVAYANKLRNRLTNAEILLWQHLQKAMLRWDRVFESQGIVGCRFIADFVCHETMLIVEVDGSIHKKRSVKAKDRYRTMVLEALGYRIIRFRNAEVFKSPSAVIAEIRKHV